MDGNLSDASWSDGSLSEGSLSDAGLSDAGLSDAGLSDAGLSETAVRKEAESKEAESKEAESKKENQVLSDAAMLLLINNNVKYAYEFDALVVSTKPNDVTKFVLLISDGKRLAEHKTYETLEALHHEMSRTVAMRQLRSSEG